MDKIYYLALVYRCGLIYVYDEVLDVYVSVIQHPVEKAAFQFFKSQCKSVEILKDDRLHKKHFRVKNEVCVIIIKIKITGKLNF